jgi:4-amino-4-deoxy-L-arabinose transferase-like glycosyltransferase
MTEKGKPLLRGAALAHPLIIGLLVVLSFALRIIGLDQPPMDFFIARQYHGALLARGFYEWLTIGTMSTLPPDGILEPPILELTASLSYLLTGGEHLWVPRLLSVLFWVAGGLFLYLIAKRLLSSNAAVFTVAFYLFVPYGVLASRAFMPDPLMVMLLLASVLAILRYHEEPSARRLIVAALASSLAVFIKPGICLFQLFGAFVSLAVYRRGAFFTKALFSPHLLLFGALSIVPTALYYLYGMFVTGFLRGQARTIVAPDYILEAFFWRGWLHMIEAVAGGAIVLLAALFGALLSRSGTLKALIVGLCGGYFLLGLVFTYHIHTHSYYSLQLIPVVALLLGSLWDAVGRWLARPDHSYYRQAAVLILCILAVAVGAVEHRKTVLDMAQRIRGENFQRQSVVQALTADYDARTAVYREIGEATDHSRRTLYVAPALGYPLLYHGRLDGAYWPATDDVQWWQSDEKIEQFWVGMLGMDEWPTRSGDDFGRREYFNAVRSSEAPPEYFIVIKDQMARQKLSWRGNWKEDELLVEITKDLPVAAKDNDYMVFDLRKNDARGFFEHRGYRPVVQPP